ncbi:MAG: hypothetical protein HKN44_02845 [Ilumatobacter sp.]|nr:hypothetical protein [Ilumatobacter sp.]
MGASRSPQPSSGSLDPRAGTARILRGPARLLPWLGAVALLASACGSESTTPPTPEVTTAEAYTAIVDWELEQHPPTVDENGDVRLPVIYLTASTGGTIDINVQADVVAATADDAVVRFSDESVEAIDDGLEDSPVRDEGVMFVLDEPPEGVASVATSALRYRSEADQATLRFEIVASDEGAKVISAATQAEPDG